MSRIAIAILAFLLGFVPVGLIAGYALSAAAYERLLLAKDMERLREEIEIFRKENPCAEIMAEIPVDWNASSEVR